MPDDKAAARILVAGLGNMFLGDDGFGVEVIRRLTERPLPDGVRAVDFGSRSLHLAYDLAAADYDVAILVDALSRDGRPGTLYVLEPETLDAFPSPGDGHGLRPEHVVGLARSLGGSIGRVLIVGCEPERIGEEPGLSAAVESSLDEAVHVILRLVRERCFPSPAPAAG